MGPVYSTKCNVTCPVQFKYLYALYQGSHSGVTEMSMTFLGRFTRTNRILLSCKNCPSKQDMIRNGDLFIYII